MKRLKRRLIAFAFLVVAVALGIIYLIMPQWAKDVLARVVPLMFLVPLLFLLRWTKRAWLETWWMRSLATTASSVYAGLLLCLLPGWDARLVSPMVATSSALFMVNAYSTRNSVRVGTARINAALKNPSKINKAFYYSGLFTPDLSTVASSRLTTNASFLRRAYGKVTSKRGSIILNGQRYLVPQVTEVTATPIGPRAVVTTLPGKTEADYKAAAERLATGLKVPAVRVSSDREAGLIFLHFAMIDTLKMDVPFGSDMDELIAPDTPWVAGIDEFGEKVEVNIAAGAHMLIAGSTRSGKSVSTYSLIAHILRMGSSVRLLVADPNDTTLAPFEDLVSWGTNDQHPGAANEMLSWVRAEMRRRQPILRELRRDKVDQFSPELPMIVCVIDEAANYTSHGDKKASAEFNNELQAVAAQGAKYGVRLILITQRPSTDIFPAPVRSNLSCRISFRLEEKESPRMVFPDIDDPGQLLAFASGVGLYKGIADVPRRFKGVYIPDPYAVAADAGHRPMPRVDIKDVEIPGAQEAVLVAAGLPGLEEAPEKHFDSTREAASPVMPDPPVSSPAGTIEDKFADLDDWDER